ncbi:MAG TPA: hypothetical protein VJA94_01925 [Candidatus Angelobacter sp.]
MTDVRKITPAEIANAVSELNRELKSVGGAPIERIDCSPGNIEHDISAAQWLKWRVSASSDSLANRGL